MGSRRLARHATAFHGPDVPQLPRTWEGDNLVRDAYGAETYARLQEVKRTYDPHNLFHINQNIQP
ncbi:BBE domain-containing protein [Phyllobacterium chamaecytisi]|uniref:BBE domain-containing protein n=1 Tax=Phyllobacterium chamaecytisi TaxID=2876082 RepID=UPI001CD0282B|nr:BBE domain-containing protein [Phyllobacterium sp. KW56]